MAVILSLISAPEIIHAQTELDGLTKLDAVYVSDPSAAWFEKWVETRLKAKEWLNRPDIKIVNAPALVSAVESDKHAIGLMTRGQLDRIHTDDAVAAIEVKETGLFICAAIAVNDERIEESFGDFALSAGPIDVYATADTLTMAQALVDAHGFTDRMIIKQVKPAAAMANIAVEGEAIAVLPVLPQSPLSFDGKPDNLHMVDMSEAAAQALSNRGFSIDSFRTSILQHIPFIEGNRTACDSIVQISASDNTTEPDSFTTSSAERRVAVAGTDFAMRIRDAIGTLKALWQKTVDIER